MPAAGVPASVAVPSRLSTKVTPVGSATPPRAIAVAAGKLLVVIENAPAAPT